MEIIPCNIDDLARFFAGFMPAKVYSSVMSDKGTYKDGNFYPYDVTRVDDKDGNVVKYEIDIALAGFSKDEVRVNLNDQLLTIEVEKTSMTKPEDNSEEASLSRTMLRHGISRKSAKLELTLTGIDNANIDAKFEDGLLHIVLPAIKVVKDVKKIEIK